VLLALAALLLPRTAHAALLPICEARTDWTTIPAPAEPSCEVVTTVDEETGATTKAAPICDPRGASAIAPQRILPVEDSRLDAVKPCGGSDDQLVGLQPHQNDPPAAPAWASVQAHLPDALALMPPLPAAEVAWRVRPAGASRPGIHRKVYHPPR
jgi:hypothetical protein